jgi:hypothetical protein
MNLTPNEKKQIWSRLQKFGGKYRGKSREILQIMVDMTVRCDPPYDVALPCQGHTLDLGDVKDQMKENGRPDLFIYVDRYVDIYSRANPQITITSYGTHRKIKDGKMMRVYEDIYPFSRRLLIKVRMCPEYFRPRGGVHKRAFHLFKTKETDYPPILSKHRLIKTFQKAYPREKR